MEFLSNITDLHMWFSMLMVVVAIVGYANSRVPIELTSIIVIAILLLFFHLAPGAQGEEVVNVDDLLHGFANPALLTVLCLLVMGQAVVQTGALNEVANVIMKITRGQAFLAIFITLLFVMVVSAFLNNTPVVVIFIPIMAAMMKSLNTSVSRVMMPLSFVSILGGMTTIIGSSTNLLVSGVVEDLGYTKFGFFDFSMPGMFLAAIGFVYVLFIMPRLLKDRASLARTLAEEDIQRNFVAQFDIEYSSDLVGQKIVNDGLAEHKELVVRMVQRGEHAFLPPFDEDFIIRPRDTLVVAAPKEELSRFFSQNPESIEHHLAQLHGVEEGEESEELSADLVMAEIVVAPASKIVGKTLEQSGFRHQFQSVVLGIERQSKLIRAKLTEIRLSAGDVLLVMGHRDDIIKLHESRDFLLMEWSSEDIHSGSKAGLTALIFGAVVGSAALGIMPIIVASFLGVAAVLMAGCLNLRQAARSLDLKIVLTIAASIALGTALQKTGGAEFIASSVINLMEGASALMILAVMFLLMMFTTNVLSNNAAAVLFTPIAYNLAAQLNVAPEVFLFAVVFACNCSFITPIGYQTNLMVMGPGHYKFNDFIRAGVPLALLIWIGYCAYAVLFMGL